MTPDDHGAFTALLADIHAFYRRDFSVFSGSVWWRAMQPFDLAAVADALNRQCVNPDAGQFMPMPADVVKMLQGSTQDAALVAWAKVDRAVRSCGTHASVVFDDPVIHRVLTDMGGWIPLGVKTEDEWPFVRNEFVNRYRGFRVRSETPDHLPVLVGIAEANNSRSGDAVQPPVLIGDAARATEVMRGVRGPGLVGFTRLAADGASGRPALGGDALP